MNYKVSKKIDKGGYSVIYSVLQKNIEYIAKVAQLRRYNAATKNEIVIHQGLFHPNIVRMIEAFKSDVFFDEIEPSFASSTCPFYQVIILERHGCKTLDSIIKFEPLLDNEKIKLYAFQIAQALLYLKKENVIHRDLKPSNILVHNDVIKLCDFGLSCIYSPNKAVSGTGTPLYMPLDSFIGIYDFSTDIFSFGVMLYELATKQMPYPATHLRGLMDLVKFGCFYFPDHVDLKLQDLIRKMMQNDRTERITIENVIKHEYFK